MQNILNTKMYVDESGNRILAHLPDGGIYNFEDSSFVHQPRGDELAGLQSRDVSVSDLDHLILHGLVDDEEFANLEKSGIIKDKHHKMRAYKSQYDKVKNEILRKKQEHSALDRLGFEDYDL